MAASVPSSAEIVNNLALAVVASSHMPLLLLDSDLTVIAASASFCRAFNVNCANLSDRKLSSLGGGEWDTPQLAALLYATASGFAEVEAYEMDLVRQGESVRRLILHAQKLDYADAGNVRLILSISDVTEARISDKLKDDLLREKSILLQELQHRVANSLQIIASVLMLSARRVQSEETRAHLFDAHHRVMSVASVQQQLAPSRLGDVALRLYFTDLCRSIGASMIRDHNQISLDVTVDESVRSADVSVSLGLIVTELVINALKHAFPGHRKGKITVDYSSGAGEWELKVTDNGIGMPKDYDSSKSGLGTSIIEALAKQLNAVVKVASAEPGTVVSIVCKPASV